LRIKKKEKEEKESKTKLGTTQISKEEKRGVKRTRTI
jgi:hypothetical protein